MAITSLTLVDLIDRGLPATIDNLELSLNDSAPDSELLVGDRVVTAFKAAAKRVEITPGLAELIGGLELLKTPLQMATYFINAKYNALGGAGGFLGSTTTAVTICPDGQGYFRHFQNGSIYWHPRTGAHEVHGIIRARWAEMGWERSFLGYPTTDETIGADPQAKGRYNHFQGGSIYWHPDLGAKEVHGAIRAKYLALGAEGSFLGYPTTDETATPDRVGRFNHFQAGSIYWTPNTGAWEVHGLIRNYWASRGWERNPELGYPISDELIPDRRIGHVHPETFRKPIRSIPADVLKLPSEALNLGFAPTATNLPLAVRTAATEVRVENISSEAVRELSATVSPAIATEVSAEISSVSSIREAIVNRFDPAVSSATNGTLIQIDPEVLIPILNQPKSTPAPVKSQNRFGDFENGVVFWRRGSQVAEPLTPWLQSADGEKMSLNAQAVVEKLTPTIAAALTKISGWKHVGVTFAATTTYSFDGVGVHNRKHRLNATLVGPPSSGGYFPIPAIATIEIQVEVTFEPIKRKVVAAIVDWVLLSPNAALDRQLHQVLDGELWKAIDLLPIDDTDNGKAIAILAVKTMPNGDVNLFIEPT